MSRESAAKMMESFATAIIAKEYERAEEYLAPWIITDLPEGRLKKLVKLAREDRPVAFNYTVLPFNDLLSLADLREDDGSGVAGSGSLKTFESPNCMGSPTLNIPEEVSDDNFIGYATVEFHPDPDLESDIDVSFKMYIISVKVGDEIKIGFLEPDI